MTKQKSKYNGGVFGCKGSDKYFFKTIRFLVYVTKNSKFEGGGTRRINVDLSQLLFGMIPFFLSLCNIDINSTVRSIFCLCFYAVL